MTQCYHPPYLATSLVMHGVLDQITHALVRLNELVHDAKVQGEANIGFGQESREYMFRELSLRLAGLQSHCARWAPPPPEPKPKSPARPGHVLDVRDSLFALCDQFDELLIPPEGKAYAENQLAVMLERLTASQLRLQQASQVPE